MKASRPRRRSSSCPIALTRLERQPSSQLNQSRTGGGGDLAVKKRRQVSSRRVQTDQVEGVGGLTAELQRESFKGDVAEDAQVNIAVTWRTQIVARRVAVRAVGANTEAGTVGRERGRIEPLGGRNSTG